MRMGVRIGGAVLALSLVTTALVGSAPAVAAGKPPLKVAFMGILSGSFAVPGSDNGLKLAVSQINKSGGILGRKVQYQEFDSGISPQAAATATSLALQYHPDLVVGFGVSAGLKAASAQLTAAKVLVIHNTLDPRLTSPTTLGSNLYFRLGATVAQYAGAADRYLFQTLKAKSLMVINTQDAAPTDGAATIIADAAANSVKTDHRAVPVTVTDMTEPILAAKGLNADAIWNWGYPTTDALTVKTAATNDFKGAIMTFSVGAAAEAGLIPNSLLTDKILSVATNCAPATLPSPAAKAYTAAFKKKFGTGPGLAATTENYDALFIWKAAIQRAKSAVGTKVAAALRKVSYAGACGTEKADQFNNLLHSVTVINFPNGKATLAKQETNVAATS